MLSYADEEEEVVKTVLPVRAAKQEVVVEPEDELNLKTILLSLSGERFTESCVLVSV